MIADAGLALVKLVLGLGVFVALGYLGKFYDKRLAGVLLTFPILNSIGIITGDDPLAVADAVYAVVVLNGLILFFMIGFCERLTPMAGASDNAKLIARVLVWTAIWAICAPLVTAFRDNLPGIAGILALQIVLAALAVVVIWAQPRAASNTGAPRLSLSGHVRALIELWGNPSGIVRMGLFVLCCVLLFAVAQFGTSKWLGMFSAVPLLGQRTGGAGGSTQDAAGDEAEADPVTTALRDGATRTRSAKAAGGNIPIWLTDGGISSNFPIHMFDAPLPGRPTFAVSLDELGKGLAPPANRVWLPTNARQGLYLPTKRIDTLGDFAGGVLNAAKDWQDQLLSAMPGQRERIAHVVLKSTEGGLNLAMPKKVAQELMLYGFQAGRLFVQDFDFDEHRWRRALVYYDQLSQAVKASEIQWNAGYSTFLRNHQPLSYADVTAAERRTIADSITAFTGLAWYIRPIINQARTFPKPKGQLRITPKF